MRRYGYAIRAEVRLLHAMGLGCRKISAQTGIAASTVRYLLDPEKHYNRCLQWQASNPDKVRAVKRAWDVRNAHVKRAWDAANRDKVNALSAAWYARNKAKHYASCKAWAAKNKERFRDMQRAWRAANPEHVAETRRARRAREYDAGAKPSPELVCMILDAWGYKCAYCGADWTAIDHVRPLTRGGLHCARNLVPSCTTCNCSKSDRLLHEWQAGRHECVRIRAALIARALT